MALIIMSINFFERYNLSFFCVIILIDKLRIYQNYKNLASIRKEQGLQLLRERFSAAHKVVLVPPILIGG